MIRMIRKGQEIEFVSASGVLLSQSSGTVLMLPLPLEVAFEGMEMFNLKIHI